MSETEQRGLPAGASAAPAPRALRRRLRKAMLVGLSPGLLARALLCIALFLLAAPAPVSAYVRTRSSKGAPLYWDRTILAITAYVGDPPAPLTSEAIEAALRGAAAAWSRSAVKCTSIELRVTTDPGTEAAVQPD